MARWTRGEAEIEALIAAGDLRKLTGAAADGQRLLAKADVTLETARSVIERDPDSAFVLSYDAARHVVTALLAHQGLRPTTKGGHYAVEQAVRAQFGPGFRQFGALRRRRNELEYPERPGDGATTEEAGESVVQAQAITTAAGGSARPARPVLIHAALCARRTNQWAADEAAARRRRSGAPRNPAGPDDEGRREGTNSGVQGCTRSRTPSLAKMCRTWVLTVAMLINSSSAIR
jgi:hypothetical protein